MLVILPVIILIVIAAYAYWSIAPGVASIPMQWSPAEAHIVLPRPFAFAVIPVIGIIALLVLDYLSNRSIMVMALVAVVFIAIQLLHIGLVHRWFAKNNI